MIGLFTVPAFCQDFAQLSQTSKLQLSENEKAWLKANPVLSLGVDENFPPFEFIDKAGKFQGIAADIIDLVVKRLGLELKVVHNKKWGDTLDEVKKGKVDAMSVIAATESRKKDFSFTQPYIKFKQVFVTRSDYPEVNNIADFKGKTIAVSQGFAEVEQLKKRYPDIKQLVVSSPLEELMAVTIGKADVSIESLGVVRYLMETNNISGLKVAGLADLKIEKISMGVGIKNKQLVSILNKALASVTKSERRAIYNKWIGTSDSKKQNKLDLTVEESDWLKAHPVISVHNEKNWPPFNYFEHGKARGLSIDYMNLLATRLGVKVNYITGPTWGEFLEEIRAKKLDVMLNIIKTPDREKYILFTDPYTRNPNTIVSRKDNPIETVAELDGLTVAIVKGFFYEEVLRKSYPKVKMLLLKDSVACLRAVSLGKADAALGEQAVVDYIIHKNMMSNLSLSGDASIGDPDLENLRIGVRDDYPLLQSAITKAMATITPKEMNKIQEKWLFANKRKKISASINLSKAEKRWLMEHPVVRFTGDPDWLPQEAFTGEGNYIGIVAEYLAYIESQIPLKFEKIATKNWDESVMLAKSGKVDVLSETTGNKERSEYLTFTKTYMSSPIVILKRNTSKGLSTPGLLKGKSVILVRNYGYLEDVLPLLPDIEKVYVDTVSEGILKLSRGNGDAMVVAQSTGSYFISKLGITNVVIAQRPPVGLDLGLGVRKDWPELVAILNKVLGTTTPQQRNNIQSKWVPKISAARSAVEVNQPNPLFTLGLIVIALIGLIIILFLGMHLLGDRLEKFQSAKFKIVAGAAMVIFLLVVIAGAWFSLQDMESRVRKKTSEALKVVTNSTHHLLKGWIADEMHYIQQWGADTELVTAVESMLLVPRNKDALVKCQAQKILRDCYKNKAKRPEDRGFFVISPDMISLASTRDTNIGTVNLIAKQRPDVLKRAFAGETVFIPPITSDVLLKDAQGRLRKALPTMFFATPVLNKAKEVIAVLTIRIDPVQEFSYLCQLGRIGSTGESYAFDENGFFLSESRFKDQLTKIGLLADNKSTQLSIKITDPGANLLKGQLPTAAPVEQELTKMVQAAVTGTSGVNSIGYRDYRGVRVLGSWIWDDKLKIGIGSEIDEDDALDVYYANSKIIIMVLSITVGLALALIAYTFWSGEQTKRELSQARDKWEKVAEEQMEAVKLRAKWAQGIHEAGLQIAVCNNIEELSKVAVRVTVEQLGLANAWIGIADDKGGLIPLASYGVVAESPQHEVPNCQSKSLKTGESIIQLDSINEPPYKSCPGFAESCDFKSCATFPIKLDDKNIATFTVRCKKSGEGSILSQIVPLLKTMVSQISYVWERCLADEEMRKLSGAIEQSPATVVITDAEGNIEYVNPQFTEMTGFTLEEAMGQNPRVLKAPGVHTPKFYEDLWKTISSGKRWRGEFCNKRKDGTLFWESAAISPIRNDKDEITHYVAVKEDITELKRVRKEIESQKTFLETTLDSLAHPFYVIDANNYEIVMMNSVARENGVKKAKTCHKLTHRSDKPCSGAKDPCPLTEVKITKKPAIMEHVHYDKDGKEIIVEVHGYPILDDDGNVIQMIEYSLDITERKKMERELHLAKDAAEEATKAKGDFLANMSHEIRTPMNAVIGMNHLLQKTELNDKQLNYVTKVDRAAHNLLGIINDILDFSKIEAGKLDVENIDFDLEDVMDNLGNLTSDNAQKKGLELIFNIPQDVPYQLIGDPLRLGQVMLNFVSNAVKFTEKGEIIISAELLNKGNMEANIRFSVKDTGIGLTEEQQGKLFQSFSQADTTTTRKFGGTGLGLAISKKLVNLMGGEVGLKSEYGKGSNFFFDIKCGIQEINNKKFHLLADDLKGTHVLIVDDNEAAREVLQSYVEDFQFDVTTVDSGEEAIKKLTSAVTENKKPYDLVLMDWKMPGMDGLETAKNIKHNSSLAKIPQIIMVTNYGREEVMAQAENIGIDAFLIKPVGQSMLLDTIMNTFGQFIDTSSKRAKTNKVQTTANFPGKHILLVEDNEINQEVAVGLLEDVNFKVDIANHGRECVDILKEKGEDFYDTVLMDLQMPEMDGYTAAEFIRKELKYTKLPVIAMSADAMMGVRERCMDAGMSDYLTKPIDPPTLFDILQKWMDVEAVNSAEAVSASRQVNVAEIPVIEGLDTKGGIDRVGGNIKIYTNILKKFCANHADAAKEIKEAIDKNDFELAERIAHTIKGVAGNIGADKVFKCAVDLDAILKEAQEKKKISDEKQFTNLVAELTANIETLIVEIKKSAILADDKASTDKKEFDPAKFAELIAKLADLLDDDDSEAQECLEELMAISDNPQLKEMSEMVGDYEFEEALEILKKLV